MKNVIFSVIIAILAWLAYMNVFSWAAKILTVIIFVELLLSLLSIILSFIAQKLIINSPSSIILKDTLKELAQINSTYVQVTKTLLILFILYCLFKSNNILLLWVYASIIVLNDFTKHFWIAFNDKVNNA